MKAFLILAGIVTADFLFDRLALWAERRGWIYWRRRRGSSSAGAGILLEINMLDPGAKHVAEVREAEPMEEVSDDDIVPPPRPG